MEIAGGTQHPNAAAGGGGASHKRVKINTKSGDDDITQRLTLRSHARDAPSSSGGVASQTVILDDESDITMFSGSEKQRVNKKAAAAAAATAAGSDGSDSKSSKASDKRSASPEVMLGQEPVDYRFPTGGPPSGGALFGRLNSTPAAVGVTGSGGGNGSGTGSNSSVTIVGSGVGGGAVPTPGSSALLQSTPQSGQRAESKYPPVRIDASPDISASALIRRMNSIRNPLPTATQISAARQFAADEKKKALDAMNKSNFSDAKAGFSRAIDALLRVTEIDVDYDSLWAAPPNPKLVAYFSAKSQNPGSLDAPPLVHAIIH